ncbi:MAG: phosphotransferase family protein, partial [Betaproteobacteria bacterium]
MSAVDPRADRVARAAGFDAARLDAFLRGAVPGLTGPMRLARIGGGQSNPTFFVDFDERALVLRKQPGGELLPSAHAVDREFRVMRALASSEVPVPRTVLFHAGRDVVGTPFYLMEKIVGRVFATHALPGVAPDERLAMYASMARTLAALHRVDPDASGLADFGRPGNYFARQVARWSKQWAASRTRANPALDRLIAWLPDHIPPGDEIAICHGDYRIGNLMFDPVEPRVVAVLDWELSTLGHPLADMGFNAMAWHTRPDEYGGVHGLDLAALGIPTLDAYEALYVEASGRADRIAPFHVAFAL